MSHPISLLSHLNDPLCFLLFPGLFLQNESRNAVTSQEASHLAAWKTQNHSTLLVPSKNAQAVPAWSEHHGTGQQWAPVYISFFFLKYRTFSSIKLVSFNLLLTKLRAEVGSLEATPALSPRYAPFPESVWDSAERSLWGRHSRESAWASLPKRIWVWRFAVAYLTLFASISSSLQWRLVIFLQLWWQLNGSGG